jgi:hypothetical protein
MVMIMPPLIPCVQGSEPTLRNDGGYGIGRTGTSRTMPTERHHFKAISIGGELIEGASGTLVADTTPLDVATPGDPADVQQVTSWHGRIIAPDPSSIYDRLLDGSANGVPADFTLDDGTPVHGAISLSPAYPWDGQGEVEFQGNGTLRGIRFPDSFRSR